MPSRLLHILGVVALFCSVTIIAQGSPRSALAVSGNVNLSGESCANGLFGGYVNVAFPYTGTITVELFYNGSGGQSEFSPTKTFDVTFNNSTQGFYSFSGLAPTNPPSGPSSYIAGAIGYSGSPALDASASNAKSRSLECSGTTASLYSRLSVHAVRGMHIVRWYSAAHVLGFNVFSGTHRLNSRLVTSTSRWYTFSTHHAARHIHVVAVNR